ncbi:hypothetical protein QTP70_019152 [Hemibagrus guttatus]|uniref:ribonuclease H n=1 Tax=Hemibagrus guttatus TaxID=175788 RepID=A0AAE0RHN2_9TELE|nr:hypothetical protein QTP70_019152 [Hemibagrus guttatus]
MLAADHLSHGNLDGQRELHCVFVDLEKAYDRVPREELWYCMRKSGVAEKYVRVVQDMYERSRTVVRCAVGQTEEFNVEVGLHQGSALSPFLFAMVMDQLSEEVRQESPWTMMFADDIVICSESREQVEENLERWRFALERRGMKVSRIQSNGECGKEVKKRVQAVLNALGAKMDECVGFETQFSSVMQNVLRTAVGEATKLFEQTLHQLKAELLHLRQENVDLKSGIFTPPYKTEGAGDGCSSAVHAKRDIGVQCEKPTMVERCCSPAPIGDRLNVRHITSERLEDLCSSSSEDGNRQLALLLIKKEPQETDCDEYAPGYFLLKQEGAEPILVRKEPYKNTMEKALSAPAQTILQKPARKVLEKKTECSECGRILSNASSLENHMRLHRGERPYTCSQCGKAFPSVRGLNRHVKVHAEEKGYKCEECGRSFVYQFTLTKHKLIHSGDRPFPCKVCGKKFLAKADRATHMRMHTGEKPFFCNQCGKTFKHRVALNMHMQGHRGEKRYVCPHCEKGFVDLGNFKRHKRIHTGEKPFECKECGLSRGTLVSFPSLKTYVVG